MEALGAASTSVSISLGSWQAMPNGTMARTGWGRAKCGEFVEHDWFHFLSPFE
jgi:hypothetical protein